MDDKAELYNAYYYKLLVWVAMGLNVVIALYTAYLTFQRVPAMKPILDDLNTTMPTLTTIVIEARLLVFALPVVGVMLAAAALVAERRVVLSASWAFVVLSLAGVVLMWYAIDLTMYSLIKSLTGP